MSVIRSTIDGGSSRRSGVRGMASSEVATDIDASSGSRARPKRAKLKSILGA